MIEAGARDHQLDASAARRSSARHAIIDSYVGPYTSIADDCEILDSEVEHSVVLEHSRDHLRRPGDRLADRQARRGAASGETPRATRLMLGDHSRVELA